MPDRSRIPRAVKLFNPYLINTSNYMQADDPTNAARLGLLPAEVAKWSALLAEWSPLYFKYSDVKGKRTTAIKDQLLELLANCVSFDQKNHLLDRIAASPNVTIADMETFNIKRGILQKTTRTIPKTCITEPVSVFIQTIGGGSFTVKCRSSKVGRAAIFTGADSVQFAYQVGDTAPTSAEAYGLIYNISTKAGFILALDPGDSEKHLYIWFRWYHTKYPKLAGPWSRLETRLIV